MSLTKSWTTTAAPDAFTSNFQRSNKDTASRWSIPSDILQVDGILDESVPLALCAVVLLNGTDDSSMQAHKSSLTQVTVTGRAVGQADKVIARTLSGTFWWTSQCHLCCVWTLNHNTLLYTLSTGTTALFSHPCKGNTWRQWRTAIFSHLGLWKPCIGWVQISYDWFCLPRHPRHQKWWMPEKGRVVRHWKSCHYAFFFGFLKALASHHEKQGLALNTSENVFWWWMHSFVGILLQGQLLSLFSQINISNKHFLAKPT